MTELERLRILAHELRSPVAALSALAEAAPGVPDEEQRRRLVVVALAAARDVERLLADPELLSLQRERVELAALASGFAGPSVEVHAGVDGVVDGDPTRLRQVLANLVDNGLRHGANVALDLSERDGLVVLDVSDNGPGVDAGFDPFARGAGTAGSTGYGLWLSRALAERHGGSLELVPAERRGAVFRLALPSAAGGR